MGLWILAGVVVVAMLAVVLVALLYGRTDEVQRPAVPDWSLPTPRDLAEPRFPLAWQGYDPDHVDAWVEGVRRAQEELWTALGPSGVAELHERLAAAREGRRSPTAPATIPFPVRDEDTEDAWDAPPTSPPEDAPLFRPADHAPQPRPVPAAPSTAPADPPPTDRPLTEAEVLDALREPPLEPDADPMPEIKPKIRADGTDTDGRD